ncbi:MAG TPA: P-II family nitrogen regulator [Syntrophorhabdaceae bacterium]|nr:P-II family nitrogen regulator [Syntrophorhabdaceae bacterium]
MKKIEAIIRPAKVGDVYTALEKAGCPGLMFSEIEGQGKQKGIEQEFRGKKYKTALLTKAKLEIVVDDPDVDKIVRAICEAGTTGTAGDGRIFIYDITETVRVSTGQRESTIG